MGHLVAGGAQRAGSAGRPAGGVAARLGVDVTVVRIAWALVSLANGFGLALYVVVWLALPADGETESIAKRAVADLRGIALAVAVVPALVVLLVLASSLHVGWVGSLAWTLSLSAAGLGPIARASDPSAASC